ncbi:DUF5655 domain-containing protein [Microbacterium sp. DT81.1]|uniref:DUF5655 domain-containing protein n=1 Tax=Microbacterium sp. DT81.1 TaxID=3393413 RepID=UPI003CF8C762
MDAATQSMIDNLPKNTGKSLEEWYTVLSHAGLEKHAEMVAYLKGGHGVSHGYANGIVLQYRSRDAATSDDDLVDAQYAGPRAGLRPLYEAVISAVRQFGDDVDVRPKRASVSLRRSKQFALVEPASAKRLQLGINVRGTAPTERLKAATGMCTHNVSVTSIDEVDEELLRWLRKAYELA